ncbi:MAG: DUF1846 domain-containing protein [Eubacteriales bacterium]|nr:DUF1846 domain-containing protein [Eubacteriales bacterium]
MKIGFDKDLYMSRQKEAIYKRIEQFGNKLYLEFGGKLFDDLHAARVLPGFESNAKIKLLQELKDHAEIVFAINANDIGSGKIRADLGIPYDMDVLRLIDNIRAMGLYVSSVVITRYQNQPAAAAFRQMLENRGEKTYLHYPIEGYPHDVDHVASDEGFGKNDYVPTTRPLVVVTAPGPCSGKMATCLSQLYHEYKRGVQAGYAKFETFPIWNLPLRHPVNLAYEAATADLKDVNMIDPFHLEAYGVTTVNYNRDVEVFPIVKKMLSRIMGSDSVYQSPTDMGVNMAGYGIFDDEVVQEAARQEIIRRYYRARCDLAQGRSDEETARKVEMILNQQGLKPEDRSVVLPAIHKSQRKNAPAMAIELPDGMIMTGKASEVMNQAASCVINSIKYMANISEDIHLLSPIILEPIHQMKRDVFRSRDTVLNLQEVLLALSICAATNTMAELAMRKLTDLRGCQAHSSHIMAASSEAMLRKLGVEITSEPVFPSNDLYLV